MKANELRPCDLCGKGLMHSGVPLFFRLTVERLAVDPQAIRERVGLATMFGNTPGAGAIAEVFASRSDVATPFVERHELLVCENCAIDPHCVHSLAEAATARGKKVAA